MKQSLENIKTNKSQKGITLIALIITIIILVILASVALNFITSGGMIEMATQGGQKYQNAQNEEQVYIEEMANIIEGIANNEYPEGTIPAESISFEPTNKDWKVKNVKEALDYLYEN